MSQSVALAAHLSYNKVIPRTFSKEDCNVDREELLELMKEGTVRITMNSGDRVDLVAGETALVTSMAVHALVRSDDGMLRMKVYPLIAISVAEVLSQAK